MGRILGSATVRPGAVYIPEGGDWGANLYLTASAPIWMLACMAAYDSDECGPPVVSSDEIAIEHSGSVVWNWQVGTPPPPQYGDAYVDLPDGASNSVSVSPSAQQWLVASLTPEFHGSTLTLTPNVSGLLPGTYTGTVTSTFVPPASAVLHVDPGVIQVVLNVSAAPFIVSGGSVNLETSAGGPAPFPKSFNVVAAPGATGTVKFQASVRTDSGGNWLSVTPASGVAPATLTASANPRGLAAGTYTGQITVQGPANTVVVPAQLVVSAAPAPAQPVTPSTIAFTGEVGGASPDTKSVTIQQGSNYSASVQTQSGGNWLSAALSSKYVTLTANTAGLRVGTYQGTVFLTSPSSPALQVPVTLAVLAPPDSLSVSPASLSVTASPGQSAVLSFLVTSPGGPGIFTCDITFVDQREVRGLGAYQLPDCRTTPAIVQMQVSAPWPGTYHGNALFTWTGGSLTVPVTLSVTATSLSPPVLANIVNTASAKPGAISPGEMITLFGTGIGPGPTVFSLDQSGKVPTNLASTQVLIDGRTAPVLYASATQVNAIVPYEVGTTGTATVEVVSNGYQSEIWGVPLSPASPGIFALGSIGVGQAAALNQDNSPNGASNPAARGSVVQFFATGEGSTTPANYTGGVTPNGGNTTALPVKVTIGGVDAAVTYHGSAPGEVAGVLQVNAVVPAGVTPGPAVPVLISVGGKPSQTGITIAVR
jgi:uncharacterized protein (TIGR03437 family)